MHVVFKDREIRLKGINLKSICKNNLENVIFEKKIPLKCKDKSHIT